MYSVYTKGGQERRLRIKQTTVDYPYISYSPCWNKSSYKENILNGYVEAYVNLSGTHILIKGIE